MRRLAHTRVLSAVGGGVCNLPGKCALLCFSCALNSSRAYVGDELHIKKLCPRSSPLSANSSSASLFGEAYIQRLLFRRPLDSDSLRSLRVWAIPSEGIADPSASPRTLTNGEICTACIHFEV